MNIGDRVRLTPGTNIFQANDSDTGKIITEPRLQLGGDEIWYGVEFDRYISGHDCDGNGRYGYCLYAPVKCLIKMPKILSIHDWKNKNNRYVVYKPIK